VDPLAEMFPGRSPYEYCFSNPINYTDPTGMSPEGGGGKPNKNGEIQLNEVVVVGKSKHKRLKPAEINNPFSRKQEKFQDKTK
jgi:hypothetical protein